MSQTESSPISAVKEQLFKQLVDIDNLTVENDPWLSIVYSTPINTLKKILREPCDENAINDIQNLRRQIQCSNSSIAYMINHSEVEINDEKIFGYLYSISDYLEDIL
jgi:hypothetical protein